MGLRMPNGAASNITRFPITGESIQNEVERPSWIVRASHWLGVTMPQPEHPRGWTLNPATVTLAIIIAGGLVTGGYLWGENITERRHLLERIEAAEKDAAEAKKFSIYATAGSDASTGHKPEPKKPEPKK
jgi:hypothetical protein